MYEKKNNYFFTISVVILFFLVMIFYMFIFPKKYKNYVISYSEEFDIDPALVYAIIKVESGYNPNAVSRSGALGLMQILPSTAQWIAEELGEVYDENEMFNPKTNLKFGCFYLRYLFDKFEKFDIAICAYNAGEGKVFDWIEDGVLLRDKIDFLETKNYLDKVESYYKVYKNKLINLWNIS